MSFFFDRFFTGIAAPCFAYRRTFTSCFWTFLCALQRVEIITPLAPRMDLVNIARRSPLTFQHWTLLWTEHWTVLHSSTGHFCELNIERFCIPALDDFVNGTLNDFGFQHSIYLNFDMYMFPTAARNGALNRTELTEHFVCEDLLLLTTFLFAFLNHCILFFTSHAPAASFSSTSMQKLTA